MMALLPNHGMTVPVLSKFPAIARITCVSSGIVPVYGQVDGRLVIGEDEISLSQIACMNSLGDLLVGTAESLQIFRWKGNIIIST